MNVDVVVVVVGNWVFLARRNRVKGGVEGEWETTLVLDFKRECCRITVDLVRLKLRMRRLKFVMKRNIPSFQEEPYISTLTLRDLSEIYLVKFIATMSSKLRILLTEGGDSVGHVTIFNTVSDEILQIMKKLHIFFLPKASSMHIYQG